jgi:hypothetical protein
VSFAPIVKNESTHQASGALPNPSFNEFKARLEREKVRLFDPAPFLMERGRNGHRVAIGGAGLGRGHRTPETLTRRP